MDQELFKRVWGYVRFSELTPTAAQKAIQDDRLFTEELPWARCMDPIKDRNLYHPDGRKMWLTIKEREDQFPRN